MNRPLYENSLAAISKKDNVDFVLQVPHRWVVVRKFGQADDLRLLAGLPGIVLLK